MTEASCTADWRAGNGCGTTKQHSSSIGERALLLRVVKRVRPDARTDLGRQRSAERAHAIAQFGGSDCSDAQQASCTPVCGTYAPVHQLPIAAGSLRRCKPRKALTSEKRSWGVAFTRADSTVSSSPFRDVYLAGSRASREGAWPRGVWHMFGRGTPRAMW